MRREILLTIGMLFCSGVFAQNIKITDTRINEKEDVVTVAFTVEVGKINTNERLTLTPVLFHGDRSLHLAPIAVVGRNRAIADKRNLMPQGIKAQTGQRIPYAATLPYQSWMSDVSLKIDRQVASCCTELLLAPQVVAQDRHIRYDVMVPRIEHIEATPSSTEKLDAEIAFLAPMSEYRAFKENAGVMDAEGALMVMFKQGGKKIDPHYADNLASLEQLCRVVNLIKSDPNASIGKIVLAGASSPEGMAQFNDHIARERVDAIRNYLKENTAVDVGRVESITIGEDWGGLRKMVEQSDMQYKNEVLKIIENVPVLKGREKQLMDLKWGRPYNYMLEHFFPKLRRAGYIRVFYDSEPSQEGIRINEAIDLYRNKEYHDALLRLKTIEPTSVTENIRGVCYMILGDYDKAQQALHNAATMGNAQAVESLEQLEKLKAVER